MTLDLWEGRALVGVVPFLMRDVRPSWLPRPLAMDFLETNLRTYVIVNDEPGVLFFSLEASSWLAVRAARTGWGLPQGLRKNNRCIRPRGSPALVVARRSLAPGKLPPRA